MQMASQNHISSRVALDSIRSFRHDFCNYFQLFLETWTDPFNHPACQLQTLATNALLVILTFLADPSEMAIRSARGQIETYDYAPDWLISILSMTVCSNGKISRRMAIAVLSYHSSANKSSRVGSSKVIRWLLGSHLN